MSSPAPQSPRDGSHSEVPGESAPLIEFAKRSAIAWAVGGLLVLLAVGAGYAMDVLMLGFAAVLFALLLRSLADLVRRCSSLGETWALTVAVLLLMGLLVGGTWLLIPSLAEQVEQLRESLPKSVERIEGRLEETKWGRWLIEHRPESEDLVPRNREVFRNVTGFVSGTLETIGLIVVIFFTGLYLAAQPETYVEGALKLVPLPRRARARQVLRRIGTVLQWWLIGKLAAMLFIGVVTWIGLALLGIDMSLTLAVLAAALTFIPNFGPIIAAVPAVLVGLLDGPATALWVVVLYVLVQTVESYLITPLIQQRTVALPPALTIMTQLGLAVFLGGVGLALATPVTVVLVELTRALYVKDLLGDDSVESDPDSA